DSQETDSERFAEFSRHDSPPLLAATHPSNVRSRMPFSYPGHISLEKLRVGSWSSTEIHMLKVFCHQIPFKTDFMSFDATREYRHWPQRRSATNAHECFLRFFNTLEIGFQLARLLESTTGFLQIPGLHIGHAEMKLNNGVIRRVPN